MIGPGSDKKNCCHSELPWQTFLSAVQWIFQSSSKPTAGPQCQKAQNSIGNVTICWCYSIFVIFVSQISKHLMFGRLNAALSKAKGHLWEWRKTKSAEMQHPSQRKEIPSPPANTASCCKKDNNLKTKMHKICWYQEGWNWHAWQKTLTHLWKGPAWGPHVLEFWLS